MKSLKKIFTVFVLFGGMSSCMASECDFDPKAIKQPSFSNEKLKGSDWNTDKLEFRAIADDGSVFLVKYWACEHSGLSAQLVTSQVTDDSVVRGLVSRLAADVLSEPLKTAVKRAISKEPQLTSDKQIEISMPGLTEFWISIKQLEYVTVVSISYYQS